MSDLSSWMENIHFRRTHLCIFHLFFFPKLRFTNRSRRLRQNHPYSTRKDQDQNWYFRKWVSGFDRWISSWSSGSMWVLSRVLRYQFSNRMTSDFQFYFLATFHVISFSLSSCRRSHCHSYSRSRWSRSLPRPSIEWSRISQLYLRSWCRWWWSRTRF